MPYIPGWAAKLVITGPNGSARYKFSHANWRTRTDNNRTTNSEGYAGSAAIANVPGFHTSVGGNNVCELTVVDASFDTASNVFLAPFSIAEDTFVGIRFYLDGVGGVSLLIPSFHILEVSEDVDVLALMPITFSGESNGGFNLPSA